MALADTVRAIGAVTDAVSQRLKSKTGLAVDVGRPEPGNSTMAPDRLNLFLYEIQFDASLKNVALDEGQRPPLWLVLKYLMTAFADDGKTSDTIVAYENLGAGIRALQELSLFTLTPTLPSPLLDALNDNPEDLKITFDEAPTDLLSKVMQGSEERYRVSIGFQVRPVMIAAAELPSYSLLVGVDYTPPVTVVGESAIHIPVIPSLGPTITGITPASFELGSTVTVFGTDLHVSDLSVNLGGVVLPVTMQQPDRLQFVVREDIANGGTISAGSLPVSVDQLLPTGRRRSSNLVIGNLVPILSDAKILAGSLQTVAVTPPRVGPMFATLVITGKLLGKAGDDDSYLALFKDGATVKLFDALIDTPPTAAPQTQRQFDMQKADAVPPGQYLALYRVNGQQAQQSFVVNLV